MMQLWEDVKIKSEYSKGFFPILLSAIAVFFGIVTSALFSIKASNISDIILGLVLCFTLFLYFIAAVIYLYEGRRIVFLIKKTNNNEMFFSNAHGSNSFIQEKNIYSIDSCQPKWFIKKNEFFNSSSGFVIYLKNGKFFRVSPHMERIEELRKVLTEIVEKNKASEN